MQQLLSGGAHIVGIFSGTHKIKKHPVRLVSKKGRAFSHFLSWNRKRPETATGGFHTHGTFFFGRMNTSFTSGFGCSRRSSQWL